MLREKINRNYTSISYIIIIMIIRLGDAPCPILFILCLNPIAWKVRATEGYRLSKPISTKITHLLYIDDMKLFAASENKLKRVMTVAKNGMESTGLKWNEKKCAVIHVKREQVEQGRGDMKIADLKTYQEPGPT